MSFCRITGRSRNLPKPHYFPIIKPMSPADAQRCCKITGKAYGLPMHHYVPVLLRRTTILAKCRITKVADLYGKRKHFPLDGFKYVRPIIDQNNMKQKRLLDLLVSKSGGQEQFVYTVKERRYSLVFPAPLEMAVRDGDIKDVMLAKDSDKVLIKMKQGGDISIAVQEINEEDYMDEELFEGEGMAAEEVQPKKQKFTMNIAKIFEDKEKMALEEDVVLKKKVRKENNAAINVSTQDWRDLIQPLLMNCDWDKFEEEASKCMEIGKWTPPEHETGRLAATDFQNDKSKISSPFQMIQEAINKLSTSQLEQTDNIFTKLMHSGKRVIESLPFVSEIQEIVKKLASGTLTEVETIPCLNVFTSSANKNRVIIGQTIETNRGKIFVPGQTMCGNTFIPGFVVYTNDGPALIPGLILTKQKHSSVFLPGQNIQSAQGSYEFQPEQLLISCKDLEPKSEKIEEPIESVQAYEIKTETNGEEYLEKCEMNTEKDAQIVIEEIVLTPFDLFVNSIVENSTGENKLRIENAKTTVEKYFKDERISHDVTKLLLTITHFAQNVFNKSTLLSTAENSINSAEQEIKIKNALETRKCDVLKNAFLTAVTILNDTSNNSITNVYNALCEIFVNLNNSEEIIDELCALLNEIDNCNVLFGEIVEQNNHKLPNVNKVDILKSALKMKNKSNSVETIVEKLSTVIEEDLLAPAFCNISKNNTEFIEKVLEYISNNQEQITSEQNAYEMLQIAIVNAIKETSEKRLDQFLKNEEKPIINELLQEAIGLAVALGLDETADSLCTIINDPQCTNLLAEDPLTLEILKRLTLMRQIAEKQPQLHNALTELKRNPLGARTDPKLRELVRESAVLMVPDVAKLKTSENIPSSLFHEHNTLAMEDFVSRNRQPGTLLIIKRGLQAVVPKEASRAVLNGQVAYTLIDETGIKHFKPLDVFSALRLSKPTARRFSAYECLNACEQSKQLNTDNKVKDFTNRLLACF